jgi:hypothetical protein
MRRLVGGLVVLLILALWKPAGADFSVSQSGGLTDVIVTDGSFTSDRSLDIILYNPAEAELWPALAVVPYTGTDCPLNTLCVKAAPAAENDKVIGVVSVGRSNSGPVNVAVAGVFALSVTGDVSRGDLLEVSSSADGKAMRSSTGKFAFAVALTDKPAPAEGDHVWAAFSKSANY